MYLYYYYILRLLFLYERLSSEMLKHQCILEISLGYPYMGYMHDSYIRIMTIAAL